MVKNHRFKFDKLVRDKLPNILLDTGVTVHMRIMEQEEYLERLKDKLFEEAKEVIDACNNTDRNNIKEEFADVLEVIHVLGNIYGLSIDEIEEQRIANKQNRGSFEDRVYIDYIEMTSDIPKLSYFRGKPEDYPEEELD